MKGRKVKCKYMLMKTEQYVNSQGCTLVMVGVDRHPLSQLLKKVDTVKFIPDLYKERESE